MWAGVGLGRDNLFRTCLGYKMRGKLLGNFVTSCDKHVKDKRRRRNKRLHDNKLRDNFVTKGCGETIV